MRTIRPKALALAQDLPRLRVLREGLRKRRQTSPLMERFAGHFAQALRTCGQKKSPADLRAPKPSWRCCTTLPYYPHCPRSAPGNRCAEFQEPINAIIDGNA